jgi:hypothetical protein
VAFWLWSFTGILFLRVVGQVVVVLFAPRWLPPMEQWQSGLLPYRLLLVGQIVVLTLMVLISIDFSRGAGFFLQRHPRGDRVVLWFSYVYFTGMILRYVIRMMRRPDQRWLGGTIPIVFHCVVAAFLWTYASYQLGQQALEP